MSTRERPSSSRKKAAAARHSLESDVKPGESPDAETVLFALPKFLSEPETQVFSVDQLDKVSADDDKADRLSTTAPDLDIAVPRGRDRKVAARQPRRVWIGRLVLLCILAVQALLSLRMRNTAFEDEALYAYVGHLEIAHWLHGSPLQGNYASFFSGAPVLYPPLSAVADSVGGLAAARAVSLIAMLATTTLLYGLTRRLFNERVGLCAALLFSVSEATIFLGRLATFDAPALFLLAFATWIVVRTAAFRWPAYLLAAPIASLAVATKYASVLFVPSIVLIAGLAAWPSSRRRAVVAPLALGSAIAAILAAAFHLAGGNYRTGIEITTLDRVAGTTPVGTLLWDSVQWVGVAFAFAVIGAVGYAFRPNNEPGEPIAPGGPRIRRVLLGAVMAGSALLAPAEQIRIHTVTSLPKHIGFGLFLAAPIAGVGLARLLGDHFRRAQMAVAVWGTVLALGMTQASNLFQSWPNSTVFVADFARYLQPGAHYLVEVDEVPIYYLRRDADAQPSQFTSTYLFSYKNSKGKVLTGDAAYVAALQAGYFRIVGYNYQTTPKVDSVIAKTLATDKDYRLAAKISNGKDTPTQYIWVRVTPTAKTKAKSSRKKTGVRKISTSAGG
jgi:Dolichyl-phosphate-mannose-protein mannosyltransferase